MSTEKPIAGGDIKPGMTIILKPGGEPFTVAQVTPGNEVDNLLYLYDDDLNLTSVLKTRWYAEKQACTCSHPSHCPEHRR